MPRPNVPIVEPVPLADNRDRPGPKKESLIKAPAIVNVAPTPAPVVKS